MTINKQLTILMLTITLFSIIVGVSNFKAAEAAKLHQLNSMHFNYVIELNELIINTPNVIPDTKRLRRIVKDIQDQPQACVDLGTTFNRFIMKLTHTENIIAICQHDVDVAQDLLDNITLFEAGTISSVEMTSHINDCYDKFRANSTEFIEPVDKLTTFILKTSTTSIAFISVIFFLVALTITKTISKMVQRMKETSAELAISEEKNRLLAHSDMLTELPNRNALDIKINEAIAISGNNKFAVFFIDLDRFKDVNDTRGHAQGDKLLITIAKRLSHTMRDNDDIFRFGGDEFVAIVHFSESIDEIHSIASRLIKVIADPILLEKTQVYVTGSIGISTYPDNANDAESLIKYADTAMYQAKNEGKNQYLLYQQDFSKEHTRRLSYESQLRAAISKDQLQIAYQPVVNLNTYATQGTEALLRWQLDEETMVSPEVFIPIAEYSGQIIEIGEWVLRNACHQNKIWRESGAKDLNIAINVSPYQLYDRNFPKLVQSIISEFDIPRHCLDIEITESMIVSENESFIKTLNELSEMGVRLLMDDFGTGYSCLSYLRKLPFDILKIDKSFVTHYDTIASTIIAMGKQLDMKIIAEGVETQQSLDLLQEQKCEFAQGYFFQRPISAEQLDIFKTYETKTQKVN